MSLPQPARCRDPAHGDDLTCASSSRDDSALFREGLTRPLTEAGDEVLAVADADRPPGRGPSRPARLRHCRRTDATHHDIRRSPRRQADPPAVPAPADDAAVPAHRDPPVSSAGRLGRLRLPPQGPGATAWTISSTPSAGSLPEDPRSTPNRRRPARLRQPQRSARPVCPHHANTKSCPSSPKDSPTPPSPPGSSSQNAPSKPTCAASSRSCASPTPATHTAGAGSTRLPSHTAQPQA